jgi:hypothetical protein
LCCGDSAKLKRKEGFSRRKESLVEESEEDNSVNSLNGKGFDYGGKGTDNLPLLQEHRITNRLDAQNRKITPVSHGGSDARFVSTTSKGGTLSKILGEFDKRHPERKSSDENESKKTVRFEN